MDNYIRVLIKRTWPGDHVPQGPAQVDVRRGFAGPDFNLHDVLAVFEDALRGSGYDCPYEHLDVIQDDEP